MIKKMTIEKYHKADGLSKSMIDELIKSPAHLKTYMESPDNETEALLLGSLFHTMVLEPKKLNKEYAVAPVCDRRTAAGKQIYAQFMEENPNKKIITNDQFEQVKKWSDAVLKHPVASKFLKGKGKNEVSIFWNDEETGEFCKARPDRIQDDYIIDLKSAVSTQPDDFQRAAYKLGYHRQSYWFGEAFEKEFGYSPKGFLFISVEKTAPFNVVVYEADEFFKEIGGKECRNALATYHYCKEKNNWFGYDGAIPEIQPLGLPNYIISKNMEEV